MEAYDVGVIGGGLAGLTCALELAGAGKRVVLFEKKSYPFHKVCGEYVSNEVLPYLHRLGFDPFSHGAASITRFSLTAVKGKGLKAPLDLGGFGLSRFTMDAALAALCEAAGVDVRVRTRVTEVVKMQNGHTRIITAAGDQVQAGLAIGSWGKREAMDKKLDRPFMEKRTGFMGVKYHLEGDFPADEISLHLFPGGYCGLSRIEGGKYDLCYLYRRGELAFRSLDELLEKALFINPALKDIFRRATVCETGHEVINEISFAPKETVKDGVLMCGDAAGLITPLCGNGMAMAIRSAHLLAGCILQHGPDKEAVARHYAPLWQKTFRARLSWGRILQGMFYQPALTATGMGIMRAIPGIFTQVVKGTHGKPMV
jgi:flavin-dependent dehydrogenase